jgi:O-antigen ligase
MQKTAAICDLYESDRMKLLVKVAPLFLTLLYCSNAYIFFFQTGVTSVKPVYWDFITIGMAFLFMLLTQSGGKTRIPLVITIILLLFLCNSIICYFYSIQGENELQALIDNVRVIVLFFVFLILFQASDAISSAKLALLIIVLFSVPMNFIDLMTANWTTVPGRAAGLYMNPTVSGSMLVISMVLSVSLLPQKIRLLYCLFVGAGVFVTFSRGGWILWVLAIVGLLSIKELKFTESSTGLRTSAFIGILCSLLIFDSLVTGGALRLLEDIGLTNYLTTNTIQRLGYSGSAFADSSTQSRIDAVHHALAIVSNKPWLGAGIGIDRDWPVETHNTYLRMAVEGGVLRLLIYLGLLVVVWRRVKRIEKVSLAVYLVSSFFAHDNFLVPPVILMLALMTASYKAKERLTFSD